MVDQLTNVLDAAGNVVVLDRLALNSNTLIEPHEVGGGEETAPEAAGATNRIQHRADRPLSVGPGHVQEIQPVMWIVHLRQETANIGETEFDPPVLSPVEPRQSLAIRVFQKTPDLVFGPG